MTVVRENLIIGLNQNQPCNYQTKTVLKMPFNTKMYIQNLDESILELIIVKAPAPASYYN